MIATLGGRYSFVSTSVHSGNTEGAEDRDRAGGRAGRTEGTEAVGATQPRSMCRHREDLEQWKHLSKIEKRASLSFSEGTSRIDSVR